MNLQICGLKEIEYLIKSEIRKHNNLKDSAHCRIRKNKIFFCKIIPVTRDLTKAYIINSISSL